FIAAWITDEPCDTAIALPFEPAALDIVATEVVPDVQVTWFVRFCVELSEKVPVAVNCCVNPLGTFGLAGVTVIEVRLGADWTVIVPDIPLAVPFPMSLP